MIDPLAASSGSSILSIADAYISMICELANKIISCVTKFFKHYICYYQTEILNIEPPPVTTKWDRIFPRFESIGKWIKQIKRQPLLVETRDTRFLNLEKTNQEVKPIFQLTHTEVVQRPLVKIKLKKQQLVGFPEPIVSALRGKYVKLYLSVYAAPSPRYRQTFTLNILNKQDLHTGCFCASNLNPTRKNGMKMEKYAKWHANQGMETLNTNDSKAISYGIFSWFNQTHGGAEVIIFLNDLESEQAKAIGSAKNIYDVIHGLDPELEHLLRKIFIEFAYQGKILLD